MKKKQARKRKKVSAEEKRTIQAAKLMVAVYLIFDEAIRNGTLQKILENGYPKLNQHLQGKE